MNKVGCCIALIVFSVFAGCSGGGGGGPGPDTDPPKIESGPSVSGLDVREARIQWTTDKDATSIVFYGTTSSYTDSVKTGALVSSHSVRLTGLDPLTLYHYKVASDDAGGRRVSSGDRTFTTLAPTAELLDEGWDFFEEDELDSALARFEAAYSYEPDDIDVLEALGWVLLRLYRFEAGGGELSARSVLEEALDIDSDRVNCLVAVAFVYHALELHQDAIAAAEEALSVGGSGYIFNHDTDIGASDVRYCLMLSLVATGDFTGALDHAKIIDPTIDIDSGDASTWDGHSSFEEAVVVMVESLRDSV
jgi:hypothetical protein